MSSYRLLIRSLAVVNLLLVLFLIGRNYLLPAQQRLLLTNSPNVGGLPLLSFRDDNGLERDTSAFYGKPLFVQFINSHVDQQIESVRWILSKVPQNPVSFFLITNDSLLLRQRIAYSGAGVVVAEDRTYRLRDALGSPRCCEKWLLFDGNGKYVSSGAYDSGDASSALLSLADKTAAYSNELLSKVFEKLMVEGKVGRNRSLKPSDTDGILITIMFSSVCTGCASGTLVELLNAHAKHNDARSYLALVPSTFSRRDAENLRVNLGLCFSVERASSALSKEWVSLNRRYGEKSINGSVVVTKNGKVISVVNGIEETRSLLERVSSAR